MTTITGTRFLKRFADPKALRLFEMLVIADRDEALEAAMADYRTRYVIRCMELEDSGMSCSDAQAVVDVEVKKAWVESEQE